MLRTKNKWLSGLAVTLGCVVPSALSAGCASEEQPSEDVSESAATLGVEVASCSQAGSSGHNATSSALVLSMGSVTSLVFGVVNGYVTVNGYACVKTTGAKLTPAMVKKVTITGSAGTDDKVVIDTLSGAFGATILASTGGIAVDLLGGTDTFSIRGASAADKWSAGMAASDLYFEISGDTTADIKVSGTEAVNVSLSSGNDTFTGMGGTFTATHLAAGPVTTLTPVTLNMAINGGDGDDTVTGGVGDDVVNGGAGNDIYKASALVPVTQTTDGDDTFLGGAGTDKADYSARTADLTVVMDGATNSGDLLSETDLVGIDVEDFIGGAGADAITGNALGNHIQGGAGDDTIGGGPAGNCVTTAPIDADVLDGEGDNDTFDQGALADCGDIMNGGAGTDRVDYQARPNTQDLSISIDGSANDGNPAAGAGEKDNVKGDIEIVIGGQGKDTIVGSANADELHGGPGDDVVNGGAGNDVISGDSGNDILNGEAGDDTFDESGVDPEYTVAENKGDGNDIINGGTHDTLGLDTVDYHARVALKPVTVTICADSSKLTGNSALPAMTYPMCSDDDGALADTESDQVVNVNHLIGGLGDDSLTGHTGDDIIEGGAGDDDLFGGGGNDQLYGDDGVDTMNGETGDDTLDGNDTDSDADVYDGGAGEGDICITATGETPTNCEL